MKDKRFHRDQGDKAQRGRLLPKTPLQAWWLTIRSNVRNMEFFSEEWGVCSPHYAQQPLALTPETNPKNVWLWVWSLKLARSTSRRWQNYRLQRTHSLKACAQTFTPESRARATLWKAARPYICGDPLIDLKATTGGAGTCWNSL